MLKTVIFSEERLRVWMVFATSTTRRGAQKLWSACTWVTAFCMASKVADAVVAALASQVETRIIYNVFAEELMAACRDMWLMGVIW